MLLHRHDEALACYSSVLKKQPNNCNALFRRGLVLKALKRYDEAATDLEAAKALRPLDARFYMNYSHADVLLRLPVCRPGQERVV